MIVRALLIAACLAGAVVAIAERRDLTRCDDARADVFRTGGADAAAIDAIREHCRGTGALLAAAGALRSQGRTDQALVLAREAVEAEPDNALAWRGVLALASGEEADEAEARLEELDPRSLKRSAGRSTR